MAKKRENLGGRLFPASPGGGWGFFLPKKKKKPKKERLILSAKIHFCGNSHTYKTRWIHRKLFVETGVTILSICAKFNRYSVLGIWEKIGVVTSRVALVGYNLAILNVTPENLETFEENAKGVLKMAFVGNISHTS